MINEMHAADAMFSKFFCLKFCTVAFILIFLNLEKVA